MDFTREKVKKYRQSSFNCLRDFPIFGGMSTEIISNALGVFTNHLPPIYHTNCLLHY